MKDKEKSSGCKCPFCETELKNSCFEPHFCSPCGVTRVVCEKCGESFSDKLKACPKCGNKRAGK
ncbi:MAG: hypothetical protein A2219_04080 [Elusimicrobia bacterium RIFOXYA2_FULL_50_26]|nr:MAG: hypothetical protein A2219_04080 [Elusimicrobia bacterium RIFOXYA2_FULL_50_26]OGS24868.1 MAG: hypothetical protein A2314_08815 [Elusimicrobia bacterium RIFOXYB2_FULL_50_12]